MKVADSRQILPLIFLLLARFCTASKLQYSEHPALSPKPPGIDAVSVLKARERHQDSIFNEAVHILDSMTTSPSCNRVAATRLVASCQTFTDGKDNTQAGGPESLDILRSVYAARLALCEIKGTGIAIPPSCLPITVSPPPHKIRFGFVNRHRGSDGSSDEIPKDLLEQCLKTLESRPQWWTSYSNSRQNALVICHASRIETEKQELLDLHRSIAKSSLKLNDGLQEALQNAAAQSEQQTAFMQAVQGLQEKIVADIDMTDSLLKRTFGNFLQEIAAGIGYLQDTLSVALSNARMETGVLETDIRNVSSQVRVLQRILQSMHEDAIIRSQDELLAQETNAVATRDLASSLRLSLQSILDSDINKIYHEMHRFDAAMEWLAIRMNMILEQENRMTERLQSMETYVQQSELKANELQKAQDKHAEALSAQSQTQEAIQFHAQVSQTLLSKVSASAANLQSVIDDAAFKFKYGPGFTIGGYSTWYICAILIVIIAVQNMKTAIALFFLFLGHSVALIAWKFFTYTTTMIPKPFDTLH